MQNLEIEFVQKIAQNEDLIAKKAKIYSRILTDTALAEMMSQIARNREENAATWLEAISSQPLDEKQQNERGDGNEV